MVELEYIPYDNQAENHIRFHGGFLEDQNLHTTQGTDGDMGYFYRMQKGARHLFQTIHAA